MSIDRISSFDADVENVRKLGDRPAEDNNLTSEQLKRTFDKAAVDIKSWLNSVLVGYINGTIAPKVDELAGRDAHIFQNAAVLDGITQELADHWTAAYNARHSHENKAVLDGITQAMIARWENTANGGANFHSHENKAALDRLTADNVTDLRSLHGNIGALTALTGGGAGLAAIGAAPAMRLLWANPSPDGAFPAQTVTAQGGLDIRSFTMFLFVCRVNSSYNEQVSMTAYAPTENQVTVLLNAGRVEAERTHGEVVRQRYVTIDRQQRQFRFTTGRKAGGYDHSNSDTDRDCIMIPQYIIGMNVS